QARHFRPGLDDMLVTMVGHASQDAHPAQLSMRIDMQWDVLLAAKQRGRTRTVVGRDLRNGAPRPRALPRGGLPRLKIFLTLVLPFFLLFLVVRHVEPGTAEPADDRQ